MKLKTLLLLGGLLAAAPAARAQAWAGPLPVDSASGYLVYQGRVAVPGASATVLHRRATAYLWRTGQRVHTLEDSTLTAIGLGWQWDISYRLVIESAAGSYFYRLVNFEYSERAGGDFGGRGDVPVEEILQREKKEATTRWQDWQAKIAASATQAIAEMQAAMKE